VLSANHLNGKVPPGAAVDFSRCGVTDVKLPVCMFWDSASAMSAAVLEL
jgi:hypothetical protein